MRTMPALASASLIEKGWYYLHRLICGAVPLFLIAPILAIIPLSFNSVPFFVCPMPALSLWYQEFFLTNRWQAALLNSIVVALSVTLPSSTLGTLAVLGLSRPNFSWRTAVTSLISPMIVPVVITAVGVYFFFADVGLLNSYTGLILAHTTLETPFVVITVTTTLKDFDHSPTPCGSEPGRDSGHGVLQGHPAADTARHDLRRALRLRYLVPRGGGGAFRGKPRAAYAAQNHVLRHS